MSEFNITFENNNDGNIKSKTYDGGSVVDLFIKYDLGGNNAVLDITPYCPSVDPSILNLGEEVKSLSTYNTGLFTYIKKWLTLNQDKLLNDCGLSFSFDYTTENRWELYTINFTIT